MIIVNIIAVGLFIGGLYSFSKIFKKEAFVYNPEKDSAQINSIMGAFFGICLVYFLLVNIYMHLGFKNQVMVVILNLFPISNLLKENFFSIIGYNFSHYSIVHFGINMLMLYVLSKNIKEMGVSGTIFLNLIISSIFVTGIATYLYYLTQVGQYTVIGASGVLYAFFGLLWPIISPKDKLLNGILIVGMHVFAMQSDGLQISFASHISGFLWGYIYFYLIRRNKVTTINQVIPKKKVMPLRKKTPLKKATSINNTVLREKAIYLDLDKSDPIIK
jgi:membrane associated rhomboid family serine protease